LVEQEKIIQKPWLFLAGLCSS